jgi:NTE family protein
MDSSGDGLARPIDFDAQAGAGLRLGVSLGGGGVYFVAWQASYLHELAQHGIDLAHADRVVGTSAGSLVAAVVVGEHLTRFQREISLLAEHPKLIATLAPAGTLHPSQQRAVDAFTTATDANVETIRAIGYAALAAQTPAPSVMVRNIGLVVGGRKWPSPALHITCVDAYTGERCVITKSAAVPVARAAAASSAVPGIFPAQPIGDRRCIDGGTSGSGTHLDLLAGSERAFVLALTDGSNVDGGGMTTQAGSQQREYDALVASGTRVFRRIPEAVSLEKLMDPDGVSDAIATGSRQAAADVDELETFLAP